jgi:hypothetical protein
VEPLIGLAISAVLRPQQGEKRGVNINVPELVLAPQIPVVPAGPQGPVVFQDKAFVPAGQAGFSWTLNAPVLVFSQRWIVVPEAAGSTAAVAAPPSSTAAPAISAIVMPPEKEPIVPFSAAVGKSCRLAKVPPIRSCG